MTDTLRDKLIQKGWVTPFNADTLMRLIEEHYADEPAVPDGREPSDPELADAYWKAWHEAVLARWGNLKESLTSSPPADGEVAELTGQLIEAANGAAAMGWDQHAQSILRAADLLQRQVPMMAWKRLPGPGDCDSEGRCWWFCPPDFIELRSHTSAESAFVAGATHCLSVHALPLPEVNNG